MDLSITHLLMLRDGGCRLEADNSTDYSGTEVEFSPRETTDGMPDFKPWHVVGQPDNVRINRLQVHVIR